MGLKSPSIPMASMTSLKCMDTALTCTCTSSSRTSSKSACSGCQCSELSCPGRPTCSRTSSVSVATLAPPITGRIRGTSHLPSALSFSSWSGALRPSNSNTLPAVSAVTGNGTCRDSTSNPVSLRAQRHQPRSASARSFTANTPPVCASSYGTRQTTVGDCFAAMMSFIRADAAPTSARQSMTYSASARATPLPNASLPSTSTFSALVSTASFFSKRTQQVAPQRMPPSFRKRCATGVRVSPCRSASLPQTRTSQEPATTAPASTTRCTAWPVMVSSIVTSTSWLLRRGQTADSLGPLRDNSLANFSITPLLPGSPKMRTTRPVDRVLRTSVRRSSKASGHGVGAVWRPNVCSLVAYSRGALLLPDGARRSVSPRMMTATSPEFAS
mmetsp:Transcript_64316/g.106420  ORF Transcript_64316/g.106420 Transcript_64316/m.106420 type:complete len:386 (+) Transcript_64316:8043-9200(+)